MINVSELFQMQNLAEKLSNLINEVATICLKGDLGSGKTTFAQFFIKKKFGYDIEVVSPTFSLVQIYDNSPSIVHCDLYRLSNQEEIYELGIEEILNETICLIEWPEIIIDILPTDRIEINFTHKNDNIRLVELKFLGKYKNLINLSDI